MSINGDQLASPGPLLRDRYQGSVSGRRWLERASRLAEFYTEQWGITLGRPLRSSSSFVLPARNQQGEDMLFKVAASVAEGKLEVAAFSAWAEAAPHVFRRDMSRGVFLMERVRPGSIPPPKGRLRSAGQLLRVICRARPSGNQQLLLPRLSDRFNREPSPLDDQIWPGPEARRAALGRLKVGPRRIIHGRFSPLGVAESREGWVLISPRPGLGDPCYDAACWALSDEDSGSVRSNCAQLAHYSGLPEERIREVAWIIAAFELESASPDYQARLRRFIRTVSSDPLISTFQAPHL